MSARPSLIETALRSLQSITQRLSISFSAPNVAKNGCEMQSDEAEICSLCDESFTVLYRRHHCRECGRLVCGECSTHRALFELDGQTGPHRICDQCYNTLDHSIDKANDYQNEEKTQSSSSEQRLSINVPNRDRANSRQRNLSVSKEVRFGSTCEIPFDPLTSQDGSESINQLHLTRMYAIERDIYHYPSPIDNIQSINSVDLFDRLAGFGSMMCIDLRPRSDYEDSHIPRSISMPVSINDVQNNVPLSDLEARVHLMDKRAIRMRQRANIVLIVHDLPVKQSINQSNNQSVDQSVESDELIIVRYVVQLLQSDAKFGSLAILCPGYLHFTSHYPFLDCTIHSGDAMHSHLPPFPGYATEIIPSFLYLGSHVDAEHLQHLQSLHIKHIVNVTSEVDNFHSDNSTFTYHSFPVDDDPKTELAPIFEALFNKLDEFQVKGERVLVHCHQGVSRSSSVVIAYLMHSRHWTLKSAYDFVKHKRKQVMPNVGFWRQLSKYEMDAARAKQLVRVEISGMTPQSVDPQFTGTLANCVDIVSLQQEYDEMIQAKADKAAEQEARLQSDASQSEPSTPDEDESSDPSSTIHDSQADECSVIIMSRGHSRNASHDFVTAVEQMSESDDDVVRTEM